MMSQIKSYKLVLNIYDKIRKQYRVPSTNWISSPGLQVELIQKSIESRNRSSEHFNSNLIVETVSSSKEIQLIQLSK
jgi:hypothetical protein